ncbi:MAG TPA: hypothetical protein VFB95_11270, partial [Candidatus Cryosericum sp.]|nr:hypothetical protein [Candidatus Cryosericum sp.]
ARERPDRGAWTRVCVQVRNGVFTLGGLIGLLSLVRLSLVRSWNYDELSHAHAAWLVSLGAVPYRDFAANHFPFFWMVLAPLVRVLPQGSEAMLVLRALSILLNLVFLGAFGALVVVEVPSRQRIWAAAALSLVAFSPPALHFLIEFRPDALSNALLFSALLFLRLRAAPGAVSWIGAGFCVGAAVLINTKYAAFPLVLGSVALFLEARRRRIGACALATALGFGASLVAGRLLLLGAGIPRDTAWRMVVSYNAAAEKAQTFGFGLAHAVLEHPLLLVYIVAGIVGCGVLFVRERRLPGPLPIGIFCFLVANLATCTRPWKQYVVSWFLLAAYFPARALAPLAERLRPWAQVAGALGLVVVLTAESTALGLVDPSGGQEDRATQERLIDWTRGHIPPDDHIAAGFPMHPLFRRDSFYKVIVDMTASGDDGLERLMPGPETSLVAGRSLQSGYELELETRPPALIVLWGLYTDAQVRALSAYTTRHSGDYVRHNVPGTALVVLSRKAGAAERTGR